MRKYAYCYMAHSAFVPGVEWHFFKLRAIPCDNAFQQTQVRQFGIMPQGHHAQSVDGHGNAVQWGSYDVMHESFTVVSSGIVTQMTPYVLTEVPAPYYLVPTRLAAASDDMRQWALQQLSDSGVSFADAYAVAHALMLSVHRRLTYIPCYTTTATTAQQVFVDPQGVCQDYAHLLIALCRSVGVHARYVCGLIEGEGQTHAWVEVSDGREWRGLDPTHGCAIEWGYVKIAHGRDADDCPINRGRFYSWTSETLTVSCSLVSL